MKQSYLYVAIYVVIFVISCYICCTYFIFPQYVYGIVVNDWVRY